MSVVNLVQALAELINRNPESKSLLEYDHRIQFRIDGEAIVADVVGGRVTEVAEGEIEIEQPDITFEASAATLRKLVAGHLSPATAYAFGQLRVPEQKSKHNEVVALFRSIRTAQDRVHRGEIEAPPVGR